MTTTPTTRRYRRLLVGATTIAMLSIGVVSPAAADDAGRLLGHVPFAGGDAPAEPADVVAPVSEDAHAVAPEIGLVDLDDAATLSTTETLDDLVTATDDGSSVTEAVEAGASDEPATVDDAGAASDEPATVDDAGATVVDTGDGAALASFVASTPELAIVGLSWGLGSAPVDLELVWRTETAAGWGEWEEVHLHLDDHEEVPEDGAAVGRDGIEPLVVIDAVAVEVSMSSASGDLPDGATLAVVDPGESTADTAPVVDVGTSTSATGGSNGTGLGGTSRLTPVGGPVPMAGGTARPTIHSRAQWGADESMMTWTPRQGRVQGIDVHHTVNANNYTSAQVPGIIRGIYAYHAQDWGRGWGDIGYNFLIDRFGRIWEGRYGGVDAAPIGAHATGLNSNFSGMSLIGNFETTAVPSPAFTSLAKLAAWKLALHGNPSPNGRVTVEAGTFNRVNGHRDSKQTTCPGRYMYNRLPELRTRIASYIRSFTDRVLDRDLDGDGYADLVTSSNGQAARLSTVDQGVWYRAALGTGWNPARNQDAGDFDRDGDRDIVRLTSSGAIQLFPGTATNRLGSARTLATGQTSLNLVVGGADLTGDGWPDLVARRTNGTLWLYPSVRGTRLGTPVMIGSSGWQRITRLTVAPSYLDGRTVLLGAHTDGRLYGYELSSSGSITRRFVASSSWGSVRLTTGVGDVTGDGKGDVVGIDSADRMWIYPGSGHGGVYTSRRQPLDVDRGNLTQLIATGNGPSLSIWVVGHYNNLVINRFAVGAPAYTPIPLGIPMAAGDRAVVVGDWTGNGVADLVIVRANGDVMLYPGRGDDTFRSPTRVERDFDRWEGIVGAGDFRGDGRTGLLTWDSRTGTVYLYPSTSNSIAPRVLVSNGADGMDMLVNANQFDGRTVPDILMRGAGTKRLFLYQGNGPGLALPPDPISSGWGARPSVVGLGDVTYDGRADLLFVTEAGTVMIYPGNGSGGFLSAFFVARLPAGTLVS